MAGVADSNARTLLKNSSLVREAGGGFVTFFALEADENFVTFSMYNVLVRTTGESPLSACVKMRSLSSSFRFNDFRALWGLFRKSVQVEDGVFETRNVQGRGCGNVGGQSVL